MSRPRITPLQFIVHLAGGVPAAQMLFALLADRLTANPIQRLEQLTGLTALTFLLLSLACTPAAALSGWQELTRRRKALGNYGFLYAALHVSIFIALDYGLNLNALLRDVGSKRYILLGAAAFLLLIPLASTSFNYWMKRLGKNWKRLHRLVYLISPLVVLHFFLAVKGNPLNLSGNISQPILYAAITSLLLLLRLPPLKKALIQLRTRWLPVKPA